MPKIISLSFHSLKIFNARILNDTGDIRRNVVISSPKLQFNMLGLMGVGSQTVNIEMLLFHGEIYYSSKFSNE